MKNSRKKLFQSVLFCGSWALFSLQAAPKTVSLPELSKALGAPYTGHVVPRDPAPLTTQPSHRSRADASQQLAQLTSQWLNQFGQAEVTLSDRFSEAPLRNGRLALLLPLHQCPHQLLLTQWGVLRQQAQTTYQMGLGQRWFNRTSGYWGYNLFYDYCRQGAHGRLGLGVEQRSAYGSMALNGYLPLSSWRIADDQLTQSRPAKGFDLRLQRQLRQHPHLRLNAVLEHYVSHSLAQYSPEQSPPRPTALTLGVDYTPLPLLTASYGYQLASGGLRNHQLQCQLIYRLGVPLAQQLDPKQVATAHSLAGSRMALIQRNSQIVLAQKAYQIAAVPKDTIQLTLPAQQQGVPGETLSFPIQIASSCAVTEWQFTGEGSFLTHGGTLHVDPAQQQLMLVLPNRPGEEYSLQIVASKPNGEESRSNTLQVHVQAAVAPTSTVAAKKPRTFFENNSDQEVTIPISVLASPADENEQNEVGENSGSVSNQQDNVPHKPPETVSENPQTNPAWTPTEFTGDPDEEDDRSARHRRRREYTPLHRADPLLSSNEVITTSPAYSKDFDVEKTPAPISSEERAEPLNPVVIPGQSFGRTDTEGSYYLAELIDSSSHGRQKAANQSDGTSSNHPSPTFSLPPIDSALRLFPRSDQSAGLDSSAIGSTVGSEDFDKEPLSPISSEVRVEPLNPVVIPRKLLGRTDTDDSHLTPIDSFNEVDTTTLSTNGFLQTQLHRRTSTASFTSTGAPKNLKITGSEIHINSFTHEELEKYHSIGPVVAKLIVAERNAQGFFKSEDDFKKRMQPSYKKITEKNKINCSTPDKNTTHNGSSSYSTVVTHPTQVSSDARTTSRKSIETTKRLSTLERRASSNRTSSVQLRKSRMF